MTDKKRFVTFQGEEYTGIERFDGCIIDLRRSDGGGFLTVLPISSKEFRAVQRRDKVKVAIAEKEGYTRFNCTDDLNNIHSLTIPDTMPEEVAKAKAAITKRGIPITKGKD